MSTNMNRFVVYDVCGWGLFLWLLGYLLGLALYVAVPPALIGWYILPLGIAATCLILWRWVRISSVRKAIQLGLGWAVIAVVCDYLFIVRLFNPPDGYYKLDVYLYYALTLTLPVAAAFLMSGGRNEV